MLDLSEYLEAAKIRDLASQLEAEGYKVTIEGVAPFDLLATRPDKRLAIEVKARSIWADAARALDGLRRQAEAHGYQFQLVTVGTPYLKNVEVVGLEEYVATLLFENPTNGLEQLSYQSRILDVFDVEADDIKLAPDGSRVKGIKVN